MRTTERLALTVLAIAPAVAVSEVSESRVWTKVYEVAGASPRLAIDNVWGSVRVRAGADGEIGVTVDERRSAPDQARFDRSLQSLKLETQADANGVSLVVGERNGRRDARNDCRDCRVDYQFEVVVPKGTHVDVATVMDGKVEVGGIHGAVTARNVNGPVEVAGMHDCAEVESVNGAVELSFAAVPAQNCAIATVNGDVTIRMPAGAGLDLSLDVLNGRVFSEFAAEPFAVPAEVQYEQADGRHRYRLRQSAGLRLEGGGPGFSITSINGDVRLQKN